MTDATRDAATPVKAIEATGEPAWARCSKCPWSVTGAVSEMEAAAWLGEHVHSSHATPAPTARLDAAWAEAEAACVALPHRGSTDVPCWPRLQGPFPLLSSVTGQSYQADVMTADGHRRSDERLGFGPTPAAALLALAARLREQSS